VSTKHVRVLVCATAVLSISPAFAQSSVQLWGVMDLGIGRNTGQSGIVMQSGAADRFGLRGTEDLGGGTNAFFALESAFHAQNGQPISQFWVRESVVGLKGDWGKLTLGREYSPVLITMVNADPWFYDTVAGSGQQVSLNYNDPWWVNSSVTYSKDSGPLNVTAQVAAKQGNLNPYQPDAGDAQRMPKGARVTYSGGSFYASAAWWDSGVANTRLTAATVKYDFDIAKSYFGFSYGRDQSTNNLLRNFIAAAFIPVNTSKVASDIKVSVDRFDNLTTHSVQSQKLGIGYFYYFSKTTSLYTDFAYDTKVQGAKCGVDIGMKTEF
jgi:predicted porin